MAKTSEFHSEVDILNRILSELAPLDKAARARVLETAALFVRDRTDSGQSGLPAPSRVTIPTFEFETQRSHSPKAFLLEKQPRTDVERVACLAYYLTHMLEMPHFKTVDVSRLNTEAAQPKFSNAAYSLNNAVKCGYLVPAVRGTKQLSAMGERFVMALPDRDAAAAVMKSNRPRKKYRRQGKHRSKSPLQ